MVSVSAGLKPRLKISRSKGYRVLTSGPAGLKNVAISNQLNESKEGYSFPRNHQESTGVEEKKRALQKRKGGCGETRLN